MIIKQPVCHTCEAQSNMWLTTALTSHYSQTKTWLAIKQRKDLLGLAVINILITVGSRVSSITIAHVCIDAISTLPMDTGMLRAFINVDFTKLTIVSGCTFTRVAICLWSTSCSIFAGIPKAIIDYCFTACTYKFRQKTKCNQVKRTNSTKNKVPGFHNVWFQKYPPFLPEGYGLHPHLSGRFVFATPPPTLCGRGMVTFSGIAQSNIKYGRCRQHQVGWKMAFYSGWVKIH